MDAPTTLTVSPLLQEIIAPTASKVAFVGVARNAGKTTALVDLLQYTEDCGRIPGILSVGIDGEARDNVSGGDKPSIPVSCETLVASSTTAIRLSGAAVDTLATTGIRSPMGEVVIGRVRRPGNVVLAGVRHRADVRRLTDMLLAEGADRVLIDGAFDRFAAADPVTSDAVVLCTGAVLADSVAQVAELTRDWVVGLTIPEVEPSDRPPEDMWAAVCLRADGAWIRTHAAAIRDLAPPSGADRASDEKPGSAAGPRPAPARLLSARAGIEAVYAPGLVSDAALETLMAWLPAGGTLVVRDPTRVVASPSVRRRFLRRRTVRVIARARLAGVTVNPWRPSGVVADSAALVRAVSEVAPGIPVVDVRSGARAAWPEDRTGP